MPASTISPTLLTYDPAFLGMETSLFELADGSLLCLGRKYVGGTTDQVLHYYTSPADGSAWTEDVGKAFEPAGGFAYPSVTKVGSTYYLFARKSDNKLYCWTSPDAYTWTAANSGNAVLNTPVGFTLSNSAACYDGTTWHLMVELNGGSPALHYAHATTLAGFDATLSQTPTIIYAGNPALTHVPDRSALLMSYGKLNAKWECHFATALLSSDLSDLASWHDSNFRIYDSGVHDSDPDILFCTHEDREHDIAMLYMYAQNETRAAFIDGMTLVQFYDALYVTADSVGTGVTTTWGNTAAWADAEVPVDGRDEPVIKSGDTIATSGAISLYSGKRITVNAGGTFNNTANDLLNYGGVLDLSGSGSVKAYNLLNSQALNSKAYTFVRAGATVTMPSGFYNGYQSLTKNGTGVLDVSGTVTFGGSNGYQANGSIVVRSGGALTFSGRNGENGGNGLIEVLAGGSLTFSGTNKYTTGTPALTGVITVANNATLVNLTNATNRGAITIGSGVGTCTLGLTANYGTIVSYSGGAAPACAGYGGYAWIESDTQIDIYADGTGGTGPGAAPDFGTIRTAKNVIVHETNGAVVTGIVEFTARTSTGTGGTDVTYKHDRAYGGEWASFAIGKVRTE